MEPDALVDQGQASRSVAVAADAGYLKHLPAGVPPDQHVPAAADAIIQPANSALHPLLASCAIHGNVHFGSTTNDKHNPFD